MPMPMSIPPKLQCGPLNFFGWAQQVLLYVIIVRFLRDRMARPYPPVWRTRSRRNPIELNREPPRGRSGNLTSAAGVSVVSGQTGEPERQPKERG